MQNIINIEAAKPHEPLKLNAKSAEYVKTFYLTAAAHIEAGKAADYAPTSRTAFTWSQWPQKVEFNVMLFRKWAAMLDNYEFSAEEISEEEILEQALIVIEEFAHRHITTGGDHHPITWDIQKIIHARLDEIEAERIARKNRFRGGAAFFASDFIFDRPQRRMSDSEQDRYTSKAHPLPKRD